MVKVTFIRHAQSLFNCGQANSKNVGLSEVGKMQAIQITGKFDCIVISPLRRAIQTYALSDLECSNLCVNNLFREVLNNNPVNYFEHEIITKETETALEERQKSCIAYLVNLSETNGYASIGVITHHDFIYEICKRKLGVEIHLGNCDTVTLEF